MILCFSHKQHIYICVYTYIYAHFKIKLYHFVKSYIVKSSKLRKEVILGRQKMLLIVCPFKKSQMSYIERNGLLIRKNVIPCLVLTAFLKVCTFLLRKRIRCLVQSSILALIKIIHMDNHTGQNKDIV